MFVTLFNSFIKQNKNYLNLSGSLGNSNITFDKNLWMIPQTFKTYFVD